MTSILLTTPPQLNPGPLQFNITKHFICKYSKKHPEHAEKSKATRRICNKLKSNQVTSGQRLCAAQIINCVEKILQVLIQKIPSYKASQ